MEFPGYFHALISFSLNVMHQMELISPAMSFLHWCIYILSEDGRTLIPANGMSAAAAALNKR